MMIRIWLTDEEYHLYTYIESLVVFIEKANCWKSLIRYVPFLHCNRYPISSSQAMVV